MTPRWSALLLVAAATGVASAAEVVEVVGWDGPDGAVALPGTRVVTDDDGLRRLEVRAADAAGGAVRVARIEDPGVVAPGFRVEGEAVVESLDGSAQLQLWVELPDGSRYFSRAHPWPAGTRGPVGFALPFRLGPEDPEPAALDVEMVMGGRGVVRLGPLRVVQVAAGEPLTAPVGGATAWWGDRGGALLGAGAGTVLGLLGAVLGVLLARGVALRAAAAGLLAVAVAGLLALTASVVAFATGQPYAVWYPLGLVGLIAVVMGVSLRPIARRRAAALTARRDRPEAP